MRPDLDLTQHHFTRQRGDITLYGAWFGQALRPCLVLVPSFRRRRQAGEGAAFKPAVILVDDAWRWAPETGSPFYVQQEAPRIASALGFSPTPALCARIANLVADHISDLLTIPPKPAERVVVADAISTDHDGREHHREVLDRV
jgi:hypothetical protein